MLKIIISFILSAIILNAGLFDNKYDEYFKSEYKKYFFNYIHFYDYRIIKAQSYQESRFNSNATSPVGARGLMQLMPFTYEELKNQLKINAGITDIKSNIAMGVYYDFKMFNQWRSDRTLEDRYKFMFASYNAGIGNILKAQKKCISTRDKYKVDSKIFNCNEYYNTESFLYLITGHNSKETETYNKRIFEYYKKLIFMIK